MPYKTCSHAGIVSNRAQHSTYTRQQRLIRDYTVHVWSRCLNSLTHSYCNNTFCEPFVYNFTPFCQRIWSVAIVIFIAKQYVVCMVLYSDRHVYSAPFIFELPNDIPLPELIPCLTTLLRMNNRQFVREWSVRFHNSFNIVVAVVVTVMQILQSTPTKKGSTIDEIWYDLYACSSICAFVFV